jgi:hypothetical protein
MRDNAVEGLLALFTSSDRAEAIAGDLAQEREQHGWTWFWLHVARTTLALWRDAVTDAPVVVLFVAVAGCALFAAPAIGGVAAVYLFPFSLGSPVSWIAVSLFWWGGALWTGASLVFIAPHRGMAACATLAVAAEVLLIVFGLTAVAVTGPVETDFLLYYTTGVLAAPLLVAGAAIARRRLIVGGYRALEPAR